MIPNINDLITATSRYGKYHNNIEAIYIFEKILCNPTNIIAMHDASLAGLPALAPVVIEIEDYFDSLQSPSFDIAHDGYCRTYVGRMISIILEPFGFKKTDTTRLPRAIKSKYFTSASRYDLSEKPRLKVAKHIESV